MGGIQSKESGKYVGKSKTLYMTTIKKKKKDHKWNLIILRSKKRVLCKKRVKIRLNLDML